MAAVHRPPQAPVRLGRGPPPRPRTRSWTVAHDRQSSINRAASVGRSGATTFGCGSPDTGNGAFPGRVIRPAEKPTLWAPIVSQTWDATMQQAEGATPSSSATMR